MRLGYADYVYILTRRLACNNDVKKKTLIVNFISTHVESHAIVCI